VTTRDTHYDTLGCRPDASARELRQAYLALARRHHPDYHVHESAGRRRAAESTMQKVNEAWRVLGDRGRRERYDATMNGAMPRSGRGAAAGRVDDAWHPYDDGPDFEILDFDDRPIEGSRGLPPLLAMAPLLLILFAAVLLGGALLLNAKVLVAASAVAACLGVVGFVIVPLVALARSHRDPRLD
jgi:hypothetical protein